MRRALQAIQFVLSVLCFLPASAQQVHVLVQEHSGKIDLYELGERNAEVPGLGEEVPGIDLTGVGKPRHLIGDSDAYAGRDLADTAWPMLHGSLDTVVAGATVHWVRVRLLPDARLKGLPLLLGVGARAGFEVFLNGHSLVCSQGAEQAAAAAGHAAADPPLPVFTPLSLACDGRAEVIAVRIAGAPGEPLRDMDLGLSLHRADTFYMQQRQAMHYGVFLGINLIILLFALVIWTFERRERTWLLLALLSLASVLGIYCDVGSDMGALGFSGGYSRVLHFINTVLFPWPLYLLLMVLGLLRGGLGRKRARWYALGALLLTGIAALFAVFELRGGLDGLRAAAQYGDALVVLMVAVGVLAVLVSAGIMLWFIIEVVRLAVRLLRSKGYVRWVGVGALVSSVLSMALKLMGGFTGAGVAAWLEVLGNYCSYVAVPVSVAIFLAVRSAHHNRLVSRQRDELDEEVKERTAQLSAEKERSDELLLNILPGEVAEELKAKGEADARLIDQVTVLFTDFKGFTAMSEKLTPRELVADIHECFSAFDRIMERHGIEKIKTIGDAYMAAGGLPTPNTTHATDVVKAALEVQAFIAEGKARKAAEGKPGFEVRIGIHSGPVVAGIVGVKKFQYDIWVDTVNTASRMESAGEAGRVNISGETYRLVKDVPGLAFTPRGKVHAKGKGELEMYFVRRSLGEG